MQRRIAVVAALVALTVASCLRSSAEAASLENPEALTSENLTEFQEFRYERRANPLGPFCPVPGTVAAVRIKQRAGGGYALRLAMFGTAAQGDPSCLHGQVWQGGSCISLVNQPRRKLTRREVRRMQRVFGEVASLAPDPVCANREVHQCRIGHYRWDEASHSDDFCGTTRIDARRIDAFLLSLAPDDAP